MLAVHALSPIHHAPPATRRRVLVGQYGGITLRSAPMEHAAPAGNGGLRWRRAHATPAVRARLTINTTRRCPLPCHLRGWGGGVGLVSSALRHCAPLQADARLAARCIDTQAACGAHTSPSRMGTPRAAAMCVPCVWLHRAINSATAHAQSGVERRWLENAACSWRAHESLRTAPCIDGSGRAPATVIVPHRTQAGQAGL
jgi:hypothetical protein